MTEINEPPRVVPLRPGRALLSDIPGMLRQTADQIENGQIKDVEYALFIIPRPGEWPAVYGWGEIKDDYTNIGILELTKIWFAQQRTERNV